MQPSIVIGILTIIVLAAVGTFYFRKKMGGRPTPTILKPGQPLPQFSALDENGNELRSEALRGQPAVILFVRGSWCPFCTRQVADLTKYYKEINDSGTRLILITPKPLDTTRRVAEFFEVEFEFWLDESLNIARQLGLVLQKGVPDDYQGEYGEDTMWPTALVVDSSGTIRHTTLSKFIVDRPDPEKLLKAVRAL